MTKMTMRPRSVTAYAGGLALALALAACGSAGNEEGGSPTLATTSSTATPSATATPSTTTTGTTAAAPSVATTPAGPTLEVTITGKKVTPPPATIDLAVGETLTVTVTSDHDDHLHVHGFEVEKELKAGVPTTVTLKGTEPGLYEVETHHPALRLFQVAVR